MHVGEQEKKKSTDANMADRKFLVQRSRFLAALNKIHPSLKTRLGLVLAKAAAMRVRIHATGCPAPVSATCSSFASFAICLALIT